VPAALSTSTNRAVPTPLYEQLQPLRNGRSHEEVIRNQRARLFGAMIETVAERGYAASTVTELRTRAGVSKRTVYDHFGSKEAYFLATYDLVAYRAVKRVRGSYRCQENWQVAMGAAFEALLSEVHEQPKAARLALIEALGVGPASLRRTERLSRTFEDMIFASVAAGPDAVTPDPLIVKGIVGGTTWALRLALLEGNIDQGSEIGGELLEWFLAYQSSAPCELTSPVASQHLYLSLQGNRADVEEYSGDERTRMLASAIRLAANNGYTNLTVAQIVQDARSSDEQFFEYFDSCEQCFLEAVQHGASEALQYAVHRSAVAEGWTEGVHRFVQALMEHLAIQPTFTRLAFLESFSLGQAGVKLTAGLMGSLTSLLTDRVPEEHRPSDLVARMTTGAIWELVRYYVSRDATERLGELTDRATYLLLAPLIGAEQAVTVILGANRGEGHQDSDDAMASQAGVV
jgi:AcrR family transcriptional regulator